MTRVLIYSGRTARVYSLPISLYIPNTLPLSSRHSFFSVFFFFFSTTKFSAHCLAEVREFFPLLPPSNTQSRNIYKYGVMYLPYTSDEIKPESPGSHICFGHGGARNSTPGSSARFPFRFPLYRRFFFPRGGSPLALEREAFFGPRF